MAMVNIRATSLTLAQMPLAAEASTPYRLIRKVMASQDRPTTVIWMAVGMPSFSIWTSLPRCK